jgi:hypothetical protein
VTRTYSEEQVMESRRLPHSEGPYFTPGFPLALPLEHEVRIGSLDGAPTEKFAAADPNPIVSDTGQLSWYTGLVTVYTDRTQALVGFLKANQKVLKNLSVDITNNFATVVLSSLDGKPLARSDRMLLTASSRVANSGMKWNEAHTKLQNAGGSPTLIEPVAGTVKLRNLEKAAGVSVAALDGAGKPVGETIRAKKTAGGWAFPIGAPVTTWYVVSIRRQ